MVNLKAYKYRIYPTKTQEEYLSKVFGSVRFVWNQLVANFNSFSKDGPNRPMNEKILKDTPEFSWLNESISYALQQKRIDFDETQTQFFSNTRKVKTGRMKFKKRGVCTESFRIPGQTCSNKHIDLLTGRIKLPKMTPIKMVVDRKFSGIVKNVTVSKNKCNQYFVSVLVEENIELKQNTGRAIGIDLGLNHFCILSNGMKIENPRWFRENQSNLKRAQRHLSRKTRGSTRYDKQRLKVASIHLKIANQRKFFHHNISTWLVNNYSTICMEDLNISGMKKNRKLSKSISDAGWSSFISMIAYKSNWYGRTFQKIDRFFPSSKTCSSCGHKLDSLDLSVRSWECPSCGTIHDRDLNASINILNKGLDDLYGFTSEELSDYRRGESVSPAVEMPKADLMKRLVSLIECGKTA